MNYSLSFSRTLTGAEVRACVIASSFLGSLWCDE